MVANFNHGHKTAFKAGLAALALLCGVVSPVVDIPLPNSGSANTTASASRNLTGSAQAKSKSKTKPHDALIKEMVVYEGYKRYCYVHAPPSYNPQQPTPVLLVFHQEGSNAKEMSRLAQFHDLSDQNGFLVVYPEGIQGLWNDGRRTDAHQMNDVGFVSELLTTLERKWHIDRTGVYACGYSDGGFFAQYVALRLQGQIAAVASVAGTMSQVVINKMRMKGNTSIMYILGIDDKIVPFYGGPIDPGAHGYNRGMGASASEAVSFWVKGNNCASDFTQEEYPDVDGTDGTSVKVARYANCPNNHEVIVYAITGGGHGWPQCRPSKKSKGKTSRDFDASAVIFQFMANHGLARLRPYQ
jgi:polyhydroxybutyrate depolymerase